MYLLVTALIAPPPQLTNTTPRRLLTRAIIQLSPPAFPVCRLSFSPNPILPGRPLPTAFFLSSEPVFFLPLLNCVCAVPRSAHRVLFSLARFPSRHLGGNLACSSVCGFAVWLAGLQGQHNRQRPHTHHQPAELPTTRPQQSSTRANPRMLH